MFMLMHVLKKNVFFVNLHAILPKLIFILRCQIKTITRQK